MSLNRFIIHQFVVSSVLLSTLQCSSAVRFSRSMQYPALSLRNYKPPWKYIPFIHQLPRTMQRRFMWKDMDDTVDGLMGNVANGGGGARFSPPIIRYRKQPFEFDVQPSKKVKYILKKPPGPPPPPFKRMKVMKYRTPNQQPPLIPLYNHVPIAEPQPLLPLSLPSQKPSVIMPFMSDDELRKIEKEQEKRVESESANEEGGGGGGGAGLHEHSHQTHMDNDVVSGSINEFGADWLPMKGPFSTPKSFALSRLHTKIEGISTILTPTALPLILAEPITNKLSYEVTEHSAEASDQKEQAFKPSTFNFDYLTATTTTESPNYPEPFLKSFSRNQDEFQPMRVQVSATTTTTTTPSSRRLPPLRTTTEHPFKRYHLHRPKPSKLLFHRTTSLTDSTKPTQAATTSTTTPTTTTTEGSYRVTLELQEPVKTTRESVRTTRQPTTTTTTTTTTKEPKRAPPEKVRNTRMNSEGKTKLRIKNVSQNESLNKVLNQHRGSVRFGEKTKAS